MIALERVLQRASEDARVLKEHGHTDQAASIERVVAGVRIAAHDYLTWLSEADAVAHSRRSVDWLRARRNVWEEDGLAEKRGRHWFYRLIVLPKARRNPRLEAASEAGRKAREVYERGKQ